MEGYTRNFTANISFVINDGNKGFKKTTCPEIFTISIRVAIVS